MSGPRRQRRGPPLYNVGVCYDPVNDEILMQPHFSTYNNWYWHVPPILNMDRVSIDGWISTHFGTLRCSFADNTWRRVGDTFGSEEMTAARKAVLDLTAAVSLATDQAWALRRTVEEPDQTVLRGLRPSRVSATQPSPWQGPSQRAPSWRQASIRPESAGQSRRSSQRWTDC